MIYSIFPFYDEFELLDLKLAEEADQIDEIIIVESNKTFTGKPKKCFLTESKFRFPKNFHGTIKSLDGTYFSYENDPKENEIFQRDFAIPDKYNDEDVFFVGDVDWVVKREDISKAADIIKEYGFARFPTESYFYFFNLKGWTTFTMIGIIGKLLRQVGTFDLNKGKPIDIKQAIPLAEIRSKHFGYTGGATKIANKIKSFSHVEYNKPEFTDTKKIEYRIKNQIDPFDRPRELVRVEIDDNFPTSLIENQKKWSKYIL